MPDKKKRKTDDGSIGDSSSSQGGPTESLAYDPMHFIRSHSKNNDPADIQTQIWEVVFEPDPEHPERTTTRVATCGGNSICIIDVNTGTVLMKYKHKDIKENFYTLAWTTMALEKEGKTNILASGGFRGEIRMFHPSHKVCFHEWRPVDKKGIAVNSLVFHSEHSSWLFCGTSDGYVSLWDVGKPTLPQYDGVSPSQLLRLFPDYGDVYNIAWSGDNRWLFAGTAAGHVGWNIEDDRVSEKDDYKPTMVDFIMPENKKDNGENPIVDSLAVANKWTIVTKCALHGLIYVWDLRATLKEIEKDGFDLNAKDSDGSTIVEQEVVMLATLRWSDTDNFYMNLGCQKGLIVCGDDKGSLWLYNLPQFSGRDDESVEPVEGVVEPSGRLMWPELQDDHLENSRKALENHDIIIDKVASSYDNNHIVAVTSNNMVCIWRKASDEDSSIGSE